MIRINLLPASERKQKRSFKLPSFSGSGPKMVWLVAGIVIFAGMIAATSMLQARRVRDYEQKIAEAKKEKQDK